MKNDETSILILSFFFSLCSQFFFFFFSPPLFLLSSPSLCLSTHPSLPTLPPPQPRSCHLWLATHKGAVHSHAPAWRGAHHLHVPCFRLPPAVLIPLRPSSHGGATRPPHALLQPPPVAPWRSPPSARPTPYSDHRLLHSVCCPTHACIEEGNLGRTHAH